MLMRNESVPEDDTSSTGDSSFDFLDRPDTPNVDEHDEGATVSLASEDGYPTGEDDDGVSIVYTDESLDGMQADDDTLWPPEESYAAGPVLNMLGLEQGPTGSAVTVQGYRAAEPADFKFDEPSPLASGKSTEVTKLLDIYTRDDNPSPVPHGLRYAVAAHSPVEVYMRQEMSQAMLHPLIHFGSGTSATVRRNWLSLPRLQLP